VAVAALQAVLADEGDKETRGEGDRETRGQGDEETRGQRDEGQEATGTR